MMIRSRLAVTLFVAWLIGVGFSCFIFAFLMGPDSQPSRLAVVGIIFVFGIGVVSYFSLQTFVEEVQSKRWKQNWIFWLALIVLGRFAYKVLVVSLSFPNFLSRDRFLLPSQLTQPSVAVALLALGMMWLILNRIEHGAGARLRLFSFLRKNSRGIALAGLFFVVYLVLANVFNRQDINTNNIYFAADTDSWKLRLASEEGYLMGMRAVHPLAFLLLRPPVQFLSLILGIDRLSAALFLVAITGSISVFLVYFFLVRVISERTYAFLFATLFGVSTAHLLFNSLIETYIFSAFFLILFFVIMQFDPPKPALLAVCGVALAGITVSNLAQSFIGIVCRGWGGGRRGTLFLILVAGMVVALSYVNHAFYPNADLIIKPANYTVESEFLAIGEDSLTWRERTKQVGGEILLFSVVAPQPFVRTYHRDGRDDFPKFNFMQGARLSRFTGLGKIAVWLWLGMFSAAVMLFVRSIFKQGLSESNRLALSFLGCLGFNFLFHLFYGFEPFLYSANWTYALIFFTALSWRQWADKKIAQIVLLTLIAMLTLNNLSFLHFLMSGLSPFIPG